MKIPYHFDFNGHLKYRRILSTLPEWSTHTMPTAKCKLYYLWNDTEILSQQLNYSPFFTEMVEMKVKQTTEIPFVINDQQVFLFFMISGEVTFQASDGSTIGTLPNNTFMISEFGTGRFSVKLEPGKHVAFAVNIQRKWLDKMQAVFPAILNRIHEEQDKSSHMFPQHKIGKTIEKWLKSIYEYSENNIAVVDGNQRKYISLILAYYDSRISKKNIILAEKLEQFILENYLNPNLSVQSIADHFFLTRQTLRNHFYKKFKKNIQEFYTSLRMEKARQLMEEEGIDKKEVYDQVGYFDENSFRKAYKRYFESQK